MQWGSGVHGRFRARGIKDRGMQEVGVGKHGGEACTWGRGGPRGTGRAGEASRLCWWAGTAGSRTIEAKINHPGRLAACWSPDLGC